MAPSYKAIRGLAVKVTDVLISATVEKNCNGWSQKLAGKQQQKVCLGLKLKTLKIERINDLDIEMIGPGWWHWGTQVTSDVADTFVRKSVNHLIHRFLFEKLKTILDETLVDQILVYRSVMGEIACKHYKED